MYRVPEAVVALGLSRTRLYELISSGEIKSVKVGRARLIPLQAMEEYVSALPRDLAAQECDAGGVDR